MIWCITESWQILHRVVLVSQQTDSVVSWAGRCWCVSDVEWPDVEMITHLQHDTGPVVDVGNRHYRCNLLHDWSDYFLLCSMWLPPSAYLWVCTWCPAPRWRRSWGSRGPTGWRPGSGRGCPRGAPSGCWTSGQWSGGSRCWRTPCRSDRTCTWGLSRECCWGRPAPRWRTSPSPLQSTPEASAPRSNFYFCRSPKQFCRIKNSCSLFVTFSHQCMIVWCCTEPRVSPYRCYQGSIRPPGCAKGTGRPPEAASTARFPWLRSPGTSWRRSPWRSHIPRAGRGPRCCISPSGRSGSRSRHSKTGRTSGRSAHWVRHHHAQTWSRWLRWWKSWTRSLARGQTAHPEDWRSLFSEPEIEETWIKSRNISRKDP